MKMRYSFEFFPPKTDVGREKLKTVREQLGSLQPEFFSCTYGAGGSTRDNTLGVIRSMREEGFAIAPHLSFGGDDADSIESLLREYQELGVERIVALRGDLPSGMGATRLVYARELVEFIREKFGDQFHLEVAAYPEIHPDAPNYSADVEFLKAKFDAGANSALTQYFYNIEAWHLFMEECAKQGIDKPIYPGIMPITNFANLARFSKNCGADIPRWLRWKMGSYGDDIESVTACGLEIVTRLCEQLLDAGAPGLHFYTMNQVEPTKSLWDNLGLSERR